jgi:hypothetical protein
MNLKVSQQKQFVSYTLLNNPQIVTNFGDAQLTILCLENMLNGIFPSHTILNPYDLAFSKAYNS